MKTMRIEIDGEKYLICCPLGVLKEIEEHFGNAEKADEVLNKNNIDDMVWTIHAMMRAGERYAKKHEWENPSLPTLEELAYCCDMTDFEKMQSMIEAANRQEVELEPEKEQEATLLK